MAAANHHTIDLTRLSLRPGDGTRIEFDIDPGALELAGAEYQIQDAPIRARLDVSRTAAGYALRLRYRGRLEGPCMRCLEPAQVETGVDAREVDQPASRDEELLSPYVDEGVVAIEAWARDALSLALPHQILCRSECAGLCPVCGEALNDAPEGAHDHPSTPDPRWAKLRELQ